MAAAVDELLIRRLASKEVELYREIRLESLRLSPEAYGSAYEVESARPSEWFTERLQGCEVLGAFRNGRLLGIAGLLIEDGPKRQHKAIFGASMFEAQSVDKALPGGCARR